MLTRCPGCATTFRITPEQLKARQGRVRCGQCQNVFNALETLVEEILPVAVAGEAEPREAPVAVALAAVPLPPIPDAAVPPAVSAAAVQPTPLRESAPEPPATSHHESALAAPPLPDSADTEGDAFPVEPAAAASAQESSPPPVEVHIAHEPPESGTLVDYEPAFDTFADDEPPRRSWPWVIATLLALTVLALQAVHHFRAEIVLQWPEAKPALLAMCEIAGCELPLPRKGDRVAIEASDLHPSPGNAAQLQLVATIKNRAAFAQQYPHLELTLTDAADKALLRRVLAPADYLPKTKPAAAGFAAGSDLAINLTLEVKDLVAVGYRLYVFYP